jgi:hypothetical protein
MTIETKLRSGLVLSLLGLIAMTFLYFQQQHELRKCQSGDNFLQGGDIEKSLIVNERDSLRDELFIRSIEVGRYETALEIFKEKNKNGADEFELILTTQTE